MREQDIRQLRDPVDLSSIADHSSPYCRIGQLISQDWPRQIITSIAEETL